MFAHAKPVLIRGFKSAGSPKTCLAYLPEGSAAYVAGSSDNTITLQSIETRAERYTFEAHVDPVTDVAVSGTNMVSSSEDSTVRLWNISPAALCPNTPSKPIAVYPQGDFGHVNSVDIVGAQFAAGAHDGKVRLWQTTRRGLVHEMAHNQTRDPVLTVRYSRVDSNLLASCGTEGSIKVWDLRTSRLALELSPTSPHALFTSVQWSPMNKDFIAASCSDCAIRLIDIKKPAKSSILQTYDAFTHSVTSVEISPNNEYMLATFADRTCRLINIYKGQEIYCKESRAGISCARFSPDGLSFAITTGSTVNIWETGFDRLRAELLLDSPRASQSTQTTAGFLTCTMSSQMSSLMDFSSDQSMSSLNGA